MENKKNRYCKFKIYEPAFVYSNIQDISSFHKQALLKKHYYRTERHLIDVIV